MTIFFSTVAVALVGLALLALNVLSQFKWGSADLSLNQRLSTPARLTVAFFSLAGAAVMIVLAMNVADPKPNPVPVTQASTTSTAGAGFTLPSQASVFSNRDSGPGGTTVNVSGEGFAPGERVVIKFQTEQIGSTTASDQGTFANVAVIIPTSFSKFAPQQFDIVAFGQQSLQAPRTPFTITG